MWHSTWHGFHGSGTCGQVHTEGNGSHPHLYGDASKGRYWECRECSLTGTIYIKYTVCKVYTIVYSLKDPEYVLLYIMHILKYPKITQQKVHTGTCKYIKSIWGKKKKKKVIFHIFNS